MWVPAHVAGNDRADLEARQATLDNMVYMYNAQSVAWVANQRMLDEWQKSVEIGEKGRFSHFIFSRVSLRPWFDEWRTGTTVSRIILGHCGVRAHLKRQYC
jgi:hypothetical protein